MCSRRILGDITPRARRRCARVLERAFTGRAVTGEYSVEPCTHPSMRTVSRLSGDTSTNTRTYRDSQRKSRSGTVAGGKYRLATFFVTFLLFHSIVDNDKSRSNAHVLSEASSNFRKMRVTILGRGYRRSSDERDNPPPPQRKSSNLTVVFREARSLRFERTNLSRDAARCWRIFWREKLAPSKILQLRLSLIHE